MAWSMGCGYFVLLVEAVRWRYDPKYRMMVFDDGEGTEREGQFGCGLYSLMWDTTLRSSWQDPSRIDFGC